MDNTTQVDEAVKAILDKYMASNTDYNGNDNYNQPKSEYIAKVITMLHIIISFLRAAAFSYFVFLLCEIKLSLGIATAFFMLFLYLREMGESIYNNTKNNQVEKTN